TAPNAASPPMNESVITTEFARTRPLTTLERTIPSTVESVKPQKKSKIALIQYPRNARRAQPGTHTSDIPTTGRQERTIAMAPHNKGERSPVTQKPNPVKTPSATATVNIP